MSLGWHTAVLVRQQKHFPKLKQLLRHAPARQRQSWQDQLAIVTMWNAALGGKVKARAN